MSAPGSKYTRSSPLLDIDCDSIREIPATVVESARSVRKVTRRSISSADSPG
jgi:hypothetical protein